VEQLTELQFRVLIDPTAPALVKDAVSFETGATKAEVVPGSYVYEHHGEEFSLDEPGALPRFFEDLLIGSPLPLTFATKSVQDIDTLVAIALFLYRDLAIHPATPGLVYAVDLIHRKGPTMLGQVDEDLARFLQGMRVYFPAKAPRQEVGERLTSATQWIHEYILDGTLPNIGPLMTKPRVIEVGSNGFVLSEARKPSIEAWADLYRQGFLRGFMISPEDRDFRHVIASRKSARIEFDLQMAAVHLNELERVSGGDPKWRVEGDFLFSPPDGSLVLVSYMLGVFQRV